MDKDKEKEKEKERRAIADLVEDIVRGGANVIKFICQDAEDLNPIEGAANKIACDNPSNGFPFEPLLPKTDYLLDAMDAIRSNGQEVPPVVLVPDDTEASRKWAATECGKLRNRRFIADTAPNLHGCPPDFDSALQAVCAKMWAEAEERRAVGPTDEDSSRVAQELRVKSMLRDREGYRRRTADGVYSRVPTGIGGLDNLLGGGLYPGLILFGARTGIGKTTMCLQIADSIAKSGRPVLYIALEMTADELAAKSISRIHNDTAEHTISYSSLLENKLPPVISRSAIEAAEDEYFSWAEQYLYVRDGRDDANSVKAAARDIAEVTGTAPVVFVDYLQLLRSPDPRYSDKQAVDANVDTLKDISRQLHTPVIAISSLNRASYSTQEKKNKNKDCAETDWFDLFESGFKESGGIEYTAEIQLALRVLPEDEVPSNTERWQQAMRLYLVKNRAGIARQAIGVTFDKTLGAFIRWGNADPDVEPYDGSIPPEWAFVGDIVADGVATDKAEQVEWM